MDNGSKITVRARDFFSKTKEEQQSYRDEFRGVLETGMAIEFEGEMFDDYDKLVEALDNYKL